MDRKDKRVWLYNKRTENYLKMGFKAASLMQEKYPEQFVILEQDDSGNPIIPNELINNNHNG